MAISLSTKIFRFFLSIFVFRIQNYRHMFDIKNRAPSLQVARWKIKPGCQRDKSAHIKQTPPAPINTTCIYKIWIRIIPPRPNKIFIPVGTQFIYLVNYYLLSLASVLHGQPAKQHGSKSVLKVGIHCRMHIKERGIKVCPF